MCVVGRDLYFGLRATDNVHRPTSAVNTRRHVSDAGSSSGLRHGFLRDPDGAITSFDPPGSIQTSAQRINDCGAITGITPYQSKPAMVFCGTRTITSFGSPTGTFPQSISDVGAITRVLRIVRPTWLCVATQVTSSALKEAKMTVKRSASELKAVKQSRA